MAEESRIEAEETERLRLEELENERIVEEARVAEELRLEEEVRQQELLKQEEETKIAEELKEQERLAQETNEAEEATKLATEEEEESHNHDEGTLRVHLIEAHLTHDTEVIGKMDPYIKMHSRE